MVVNEQHQRQSTEGRESDSIVVQTASVMDEAEARGDANSAVVRMIKGGQAIEYRVPKTLP